MNARYRGYDVLAKWRTPSFDDVTRAVLSRRLRDVPQRRFFTEPEIDLLDAIILRLAPSFSDKPPPIALWIDAQLHQNRSEGYRREGAPPLQDHWRRGLRAIDGEARIVFGAPFAALSGDNEDATLRRAQLGEVDRTLWAGLDPAGFFSNVLLKTVVGLAYAHPAAWNDIGYGGPASPRGYVRLGFDKRDPWEAREVGA